MQDDRELISEHQEENTSKENSEGGQAESSNRRKFLTRVGWGGVVGFLAINSALFCAVDNVKIGKTGFYHHDIGTIAVYCIEIGPFQLSNPANLLTGNRANLITVWFA